MTAAARHVAVDIGNSRFKLALFDPVAALDFETPLDVWRIDPRQLAGELERTLPTEVLTWWIASVNPRADEQLVRWIETARPGDHWRRLELADVPLVVQTVAPDRVGKDRLLAAMAVAAFREPGTSALIVDVGTAITIDVLDEGGVFRGGAILPGWEIQAAALHAHTALLPLVTLDLAGPPPNVVGDDTVPAIRSGLYWGVLGAVREVATRMVSTVGERPQVYCSGGAGQWLAGGLPGARFVPELVLRGIAATRRTVS